jgi:zinc/manganese transport system permease protein
MGLTALFLYLDVTVKGTSGAAVAVMFGSMFAIPPSVARLAALAGAVALGLVALVYRPLLLASVDAELAAVRGVRPRLIGLLYLLLLALAVTLSAMTVGAILSTALLIGPAAAALRLARSPGVAMALAAGFGLMACWGGILLAYDSYNWMPGHVWPVSFFIVALVLGIYLLAGALPRKAA